MKLWTGEEIMAALQLCAVSNDFRATGISIDTRTLKPGNMFIAIEGPTHDGHGYVDEAFAKGAAGVIIQEAKQHLIKPGQTFFAVPHTTQALHQLGAFARMRSDACVVAVTGSAGKTTTKEWLGRVLTTFGSTVYSPASFNNHWGVPLSLTALKATTDYGVFEIGMNNGGEIEPLTRIVQPHIAIITTIGEAHIGHLGSLHSIAQEKAHIFKGLQKGGVAIINADIPHVNYLKEQALAAGAAQVVSVGQNGSADVQLISYAPSSDNRAAFITARVLGEVVSFSLPFIGLHFAYNSLMVLAVIKLLELPLGVACTAMGRLAPVQGRGARYKVTFGDGRRIELMDDAYNANPASMRVGLETFAAMAQNAGRRIAILGEMLELGEASEAYHKGLLPDLIKAGVDCVFTVGEGMAPLFESLPLEMQGAHGTKVSHILPHVLDALQHGDSVFIKGSKGSGVAAIVDAVLNEHKRAVA
jgi:UDP-N-acetylmuramoyl-tripeptide--D-alanyl-D-alanine ligase